MRNRTRVVGALGLVPALVLAGCGSSDPGSAGESASDVEVGDTWTGDPATVEIWHDNAALQPAIDAFNAAHEDEGIQIAFSENTDLNTAVRNAHAAGDGPDLFITQTADLASFIADGIATDISAYYDSIASDYSDVVNDAITTGDRQWAVPAADIPTFMIYNAEIFDERDLEYPETYEGFLEVGETLAEDGISIFNVAGEDPTGFLYLAWEAGARWYDLEGDAWRVDVDSDETRRAAEYFDEAFAGDMFSKISYAEYSAMMQSYDEGEIAVRQLSTWQTKGMQATLVDALGKWDPEPNLRWEGRDPANAAFTRVFAVNTVSENSDAAVFAAHALSTEGGSVSALADPENGLSYFPALADPSDYVADTVPTALVGDHADDWNDVVTGAVDTQLGDWTYGPNWAGAFAELQDLWGAAVAGEIETVDIAPRLQEWIVDDLTQQGIDVVED
ncbi:ABC transporter substrate-binding protein [Microbacterium karelineae]|uniref:ABC transporter substrate-binding protein n=1 Tax=Microbacterium karelineae TaxID=2654283 RepID=UPI0018D3B197|nr:extracellular solute-binding protein [Microbacterium karelineae]